MTERSAALIPCANDDYSLLLSAQAIAGSVDEVVILDDASEDDTPTVIEYLRDHYRNVRSFRSDRPLGWSEARNALARHTQARHLPFIDADDILCDGAPRLLHQIIASPRPYVRLGLAEMWGDFLHGTGRGLTKPHFDPCHCYVDRTACSDAHWTCVSSHATLNIRARPIPTGGVLFWHAKGVKSDWRLVARKHLNDWMRTSRTISISQWPGFIREQHAVHRAALHRLLHDSIDVIEKLPRDITLPAVCNRYPRFTMQYEGGRIVDRLDPGWSLPSSLDPAAARQ